MSLVLNGDTGVQGNSGAFVAGTAVASTSGTSIDFTSIPSWVKRITVMFSNVSTNGTSIPLIQIGDSGGIENTGYTAISVAAINGAGTVGGTSTAGFLIYAANASNAFYGSLVLTNISGNTWVLASVCGSSASGTILSIQSAGSKETSATLDRVRITTTNGTDTFDAGSINILYE